MGKGGGGGGQTTSTSYQTNIPEYARPYVDTMLGATQKQLFTTQQTPEGGTEITGFQPYRAFGGTYDAQGNQTTYDPSKAVAGFTGLQTGAQQAAGNLQVPGQYGVASDVTGQGIMAAGDVGMQARGLQGMGMQAAGAGNQYARMATNPYAMSAYMSPYMQNVVDVQQAEARRAANIAGQQQQAEAVGRGAFGGSRDALMRAERERNLATQLGAIQAQGSQNAFQQAQQAQQFGANLGLQGLQAGAGMYGQGIGAQQAAINQALAGAGQLAGIGGQQLAAQQGIIGLQNQMGAQQQAYNQQVINQAIQDYANAQQYPLMQLGTMSNMLRGLPMQAQTTNQYVAAPNPVTQGIGALGTYGALKGAGVFGASGGLPSEFKVKSMASGGIASYDVGGEVMASLASMDEEGLKRQAEESSSPTVRRMAQRLLREKQMEKSQGAGPTGPMGVDYQAAPVQAARGGILAFTRGGSKEDAEERDYSVLSDSDFPKEPEKEIQTSDSKGMSKLPERGIGPVARDVGRSILRGIKGAVDRPAPTSFARTSSDDNYEIPERGKGSTYTPLSAERAEELRRQTMAPTQQVAQQAATERVAQQAAKPTAPAAAPTPTRPAPAAPAGITQAAAPAAENDPLANINAAIKAAEKEATLSDEDYLKRVKANIPENTAVAEYRKSVMDERANAADEAKRQRYMRMAEFFSRWGTTPGSVLAAGLGAMQKTLPDLITDERDLKKAKRELDKAAYDIDNATRLEEMGHIKDARALKEKAADRLKDLTHYRIIAETQLATTRMHGESQKEAARISAAASGESARTNRDIQKEDRAYKAIGVAQDDVRDVLKGIDKYKTSTEYTNAMRAIDAYNTQLKANKVDERAKNRYDAAQEKLYGKNGAMTRWNKQLEAAEQDVKNARDRWKNLGGKEPSGSSVDNDPFKLR